MTSTLKLLGKGSPPSSRDRGAAVLTERDLQMLTDLWEFGAMARDQIHALYFPDAALRRVNRRLAALALSNLLQPVMATPGMRWPGSGTQRVYRLAAGAIRAVSANAGVDAAAVRRQVDRESREHLAHALAVVDARIALEKALGPGAVTGPGRTLELVAFRGEAAIRHAYEYREAADASRERAWRRETFKPDALAVLRRKEAGGTSLLYHLFVEVDLSSVASAEIRHKLAIAARYRREPALFARRYAGGDIPADPEGCYQLILTTGDVRAAHLSAIAAEEGIGSARVATLAAFLGGGHASGDAGPLFPIWHVPGRDRLARLPMLDPDIFQDRKGEEKP